MFRSRLAADRDILGRSPNDPADFRLQLEWCKIMAKSVSLKSMAAELAIKYELPEKTVIKIVTSMCEIMGKALQERKTVAIMHLGYFKINEAEWGNPVVAFAASAIMRSFIRVRSDMNKFGVVLDKNKVMLAKFTGKCPKCGELLEQKSPPLCAKCGTAPFEEQITEEDEDGETS